MITLIQARGLDRRILGSKWLTQRNIRFAFYVWWLHFLRSTCTSLEATLIESCYQTMICIDLLRATLVGGVYSATNNSARTCICWNWMMRLGRAARRMCSVRRFPTLSLPLSVLLDSLYLSLSLCITSLSPSPSRFPFIFFLSLFLPLWLSPSLYASPFLSLSSLPHFLFPFASACVFLHRCQFVCMSLWSVHVHNCMSISMCRVEPRSCVRMCLYASLSPFL